MKTPIIFLPNVVFPGLPGQLEVPRETGLALQSFHDYMGFGTLDIALVFAAKDDGPPGPDNHMTTAALAEIIVEDIPEDGPAQILIHSGHRITLGALGTLPSGHASGWNGAVTDTETHRLDTDGAPTGSIDGLQRRLFDLLLSDPGFTEGDYGDRTLVETVIGLDRRAPGWKVCYAAADALLTAPNERREALTTEDGAALVAKLTDMLNASLDEVRGNRGVRYEALLGQILDIHLRDAVDGLDTARRLAGLGLVDLSRDQIHALGDLREEIDRAAAMLGDLVDEIGDALGDPS